MELVVVRSFHLASRGEGSNSGPFDPKLDNLTTWLQIQKKNKLRDRYNWHRMLYIYLQSNIYAYKSYAYKKIKYEKFPLWISN